MALSIRQTKCIFAMKSFLYSKRVCGRKPFAQSVSFSGGEQDENKVEIFGTKDRMLPNKIAIRTG
jgi:hypothetical protein